MNIRSMSSGSQEALLLTQPTSKLSKAPLKLDPLKKRKEIVYSAVRDYRPLMNSKKKF
jgi:hypothetical protein